MSKKRTAALSWRGPDHCSRTCSLMHCQCRRNILIAIVIYLAALWLPKSLDYSGCAIQVHTQERAILVHTQNVLSKCTVYSCTHLVLHSYSCTHLVHHSYWCSNLVHHSYSCTTRSRAPFSCITPTRAPLVLVHHSILVHRSVISCTHLVLHSYSCSNLVHHSYSCTILVHHS